MRAAESSGSLEQKARALIVRHIILGPAPAPDSLQQAAQIVDQVLKAKPGTVNHSGAFELGALAHGLMAAELARQAVTAGAER